MATYNDKLCVLAPLEPCHDAIDSVHRFHYIQDCHPYEFLPQKKYLIRTGRNTPEGQGVEVAL
jgi:hypothetical protein